MVPSMPRSVLIVFLCLAGSRLLFSDTAANAGGEHRCCVTSEQQKILDHFSLVFLDTGDGRRARTVRLSRANLQVVNGMGATNGNPEDPNSLQPGVAGTNGVGNLIVGYNEARAGSMRTGSHNLVVGQGHAFERFGGVVNGRNNSIAAPFASVIGGQTNAASGSFSSVSGGQFNYATGESASVSGGRYNWATGHQSSVSGGRYNVASGDYASVSGGEVNRASGWSGSVSGGKGNEASGGLFTPSSVSGGRFNEASGEYSTVSGGFQRSSAGYDEWVAGGLSEPN